MTRADLRAALANQNVAAFLRVIRESESRQTEDAYRLENGGRVLPEYPVEHPSKGLKSPPGRAFGAYQFLASTWAGLVRQYGFENMSPQCQDEAAVALIAGRGALKAVMSGSFEEACALLHKEWTSLPGGSEENAATERALQTWKKWHAILEHSQPVEDTLATEHYGERVDESVIRPVPSADEQEENMAPIIAAILPTLIKAAPDLIRLFGKGEQSDRNALVAEKVGALAVQVTGAVNEQEAARVLASSPAKAQEFRAAVADNFDQWMGMAVKFHGLEEDSRQRAREAAAGQSGDWRKLIFSLPFVGLMVFVPTVWAVVAASVFKAPWLMEMDPQLRGTVIGFVLGTIAASIVGYIYGASMTKAPPNQPQQQR